MENPRAPKPYPNIATSRLFLRPITRADGDATCMIRCNPKVFYWRDPPDTPEEAIQWLEGRLADPASIVYCVCSSADTSKVIGMVGAHHLPDIGYVYDPVAWGKGYATEALTGWIEMYMENWPVGHPLIEKEEERRFLIAKTGAERGVTSRRVLEKSGFKHQGFEDAPDGTGMEKLDVWKFSLPLP